MVKKICLLIIATGLLTGCDTKLRHLTLDRIPYNGDELRIDGYYYAYPAWSDAYSNEATGLVAVFYSDGLCIHTNITPGEQPLFNHIENEILLNDDYIKKLTNGPTHIGVFQIDYPNIEIQVWEFRSWLGSYYGEIINDTTFIINKRKDHRSGKTYPADLTYHFKEFSPKPDITNNYVRSVIIDD